MKTKNSSAGESLADLGPPVRQFGSASGVPATAIVAGLFFLILGLLFTYYGFSHRSASDALKGMGILAALLLVAGLSLVFVKSIAIHTAGMHVRSGRGARTVFWDELQGVTVNVTPRERRREARVDVTLVTASGAPIALIRSGTYASDATAMLIERLSAPVVAASLAARLEEGHVLIAGVLHLRAGGWVVMNETLPWRDLEAIDVDDDVLWATFSSAGRHELGRYRDIGSAQALLHLAVTRAIRDGGAPSLAPGLLLGDDDLTLDPRVPLRRAAPGRAAWRAARGGQARGMFG